MSDKTTLPSRLFSIGIAIIIIGIAAAWLYGPIAWQAYKEKQKRAEVYENLKAIGNALDNYEKKLQQQQVDDSAAADQAKMNKE